MTTRITAVLYIVAGAFAGYAAFLNWRNGSTRAYTLGAAALFCMGMAFFRLTRRPKR